MTDPRAHITRAVLAPPSHDAPSPIPIPAAPPTAENNQDIRLIGKRHGNMRSVGLLLTAEARDELYRLAAEDGLTLGEALVDALRERHTPPEQDEEPQQSWLPARRAAPRIRRGADTKTTFVLLTPDEARAVSAAAASCRQSVSDFTSRVLTR